MSWAAVIVGAATVAGSAYSARQAGRAADAQGRAGDAAIAEQQRQFDTMLSLTSNQRMIGNQALNALGGVYGYSPAPGFANDELAMTDSGASPLRSREPVLIGDTELPPGTTTVSVGNGWYEVHLGGQRIGTLRPGGPNGRFINDTGADINALWGQWEQGQRQASRNGGSSGRTYEVMPDGRVREILATSDAPNAGNHMASPTGGNALAPDYSAFYQSPDYQFRLRQGMDALQNSAAAAGGLYSGNTLRGITEYGQGLAAGEFGNWFNRQAALAGIGQAATSQAGNAAMQTGANIGNLLMGQGNARASGIIGQTNAITGGVNDLASIYGLWRGGYFDRPTGSTPPYAGGR